MENYIKLSTLNDFIFCPKSIYYHNLYDWYDKTLYQDDVQISWSIAHESIDNKTYSTSKWVLMSLDVYCDRYKISWKIDQFFIKEWKLVERKNKIEKIYLWYKYQLWWQMFCLEEMWYDVLSLEIYSMKDNKKYKIYKPNTSWIVEFEIFLEKYKKYDLLKNNFNLNTNKCFKCNYRELCDDFIWEVYPQLNLFD